jgi:tRNA-dihydrouridine synthase A
LTIVDFDAAEHPLVLQLGGSESDEMAQCAKIAQDWGYDEVNITKFDNCS